jgi:hypothetical protein
MAEQIRQILVQEQDQVDLATALGEEVPDVGGSPPRAPVAVGAPLFGADDDHRIEARQLRCHRRSVIALKHQTRLVGQLSTV